LATPIPFYNPREASPEVLEAVFVGREDEVAEITRELLEAARSGHGRHWLIRGPRGIGKSHLMGILYHRAHKDPELHRHYLPVWLPENEAYGVYSTGFLLFQIAEALVKEVRAEEPLDAARLAEELGEIEARGDDPALLDRVRQLLRRVAGRLDKTILVLLENLDAVIGGFPRRRGDQEIERLERLLTDCPELRFITTTPTRYLPDGAEARPSFSDRFREVRLEPLDEAELGELFPRLARITGQPEKAHLAGPDAEGAQRRRVLHRLTGGNPRAVVMAFSVISKPQGVQAMVDELHALLDAQTAYFEARLSQLAPRERTIVTQMALARENLTLEEISRRTRLPRRSLSNLVARLVEEGHVAPVSDDGEKEALYELRDGLFRLWFQYRRGRKVLKPLVRFLAFWHPVEELEQALHDLRAVDFSSLGPLEEEPQRTALWQLQKALDLARHEALGDGGEIAAPPAARVLDFPGMPAPGGVGGANELLEGRVHRLRAVLRPAGERRLPPGRLAAAQRELGLTLLALDRRDEAVAEFRGLVDRFFASEDPAVEELVVRTTFDLITTFAQLGRFEEALEVCEEFLDRASTERLPSVQEPLARTVFHLAATLGQLGRVEAAMAAYESLLRRFGGISRPGLEVLAARSAFGLAQALWQLGRFEQVIEVCSRLESRAEDASVSIREPVAAACWLKGLALHRIGRRDEAAEVYRGLLERYGEDPRRALRTISASATAALGLVEFENGHEDRAVEYFTAWTSAVAADPELDAGPLGPALKLFIETFEAGKVRSLLEKLVTIEDHELSETARLYQLVLDVVEASEASAGERREGGRPPRVRFALARVPPEVRKTVEELAESILETRGNSAPRSMG